MESNAVAKPCVSFIIPVFNSEQYIARCLRSICNLCASEATYEVLIIDNGSTDRTHQIIRDLGFTFQVIPKVNVSTLRNRGAALARGDYLAFVDSDVELTSRWLHNGLAPFADSQVVACGCFPGVPQEATWVQQAWDIHQRGRQSADKPVSVPWLPSMNLLVRRATFLAVSGFNEHLETAEDVDLCYRLGQYGVILCNRAMEAIHWGEARDVRTFWYKEVWRGLGSWYGVLSHGWRWDEFPSLVYPLYVITLVPLCLLGVFIDVWHHQLLWVPCALCLLPLPALLLATRTTLLAHRPRVLPQLALLYVVYGIARACSLLKSTAYGLSKQK
jgi:glycosyltransferase involved in cell wall biosynthesis